MKDYGQECLFLVARSPTIGFNRFFAYAFEVWVREAFWGRSSWFLRRATVPPLRSSDQYISCPVQEPRHHKRLDRILQRLFCTGLGPGPICCRQTVGDRSDSR